MKSEIMRIPGKGLCIVISELDVQSLIQGLNGVPFLGGGIFSDIYAIAEEIRIKRKIGAIKEVRNQTGWSLKEAKQFVDKYIPMGRFDDYDAAADKFIIDHTPKDFLKHEDMNLD